MAMIAAVEARARSHRHLECGVRGHWLDIRRPADTIGAKEFSRHRISGALDKSRHLISAGENRYHVAGRRERGGLFSCALARDAHSAGDRIAAENYYQHAEHYYRIINANNDGAPYQPNPPRDGGFGEEQAEGGANGVDSGDGPMV